MNIFSPIVTVRKLIVYCLPFAYIDICPNFTYYDILSVSL